MWMTQITVKLEIKSFPNYLKENFELIIDSVVLTYCIC